LFEAQISKKLIMADVVEIGYMNAGRWEHIAQTYEKLGMIDSDFSLKGFLYAPHSDADYTWIKWFLGAMAGTLLLVGIGALFLLFFNKKLKVEIDERKKTERALKDSEEKYKALFNNAQVALFRNRVSDGKLLEINERYATMAGYSNVGDCMAEFNAADAWADINGREELLKVLQENRFVLDYETKIIRKDGVSIWISFSATIFPEQGYIEGSIIDITERKQTVEALRESEERFRTLFNSATEGILVAEIESKKFRFANPAICKMLGYSEEELIGMGVMDIHPEESLDYVISEFEAQAKGEKVLAANIPCLRKDGQIIHADINTGKANIQGVEYNIGLFTDITERKRAEEALKESEEKLVRLKKMESLGLLAGGVAHDLNNVLSGIVSYPELILLDLPEDSKLRDPIKTIQESGHRAVAIVQDLLTVARGVATVREPLNLNIIVKDYLLSPEFKKLDQFHSTVMVKTNLDDDLFNVKGSQVHIRKALMNLISNASESIEGDGNVIISTMNRYVDRPIRGYNDISIGEYAVLSVSDDGPGISSNDLERIFEPFYSKKVMGRSGTGLGLAVVWNTIQDHKGYIDVTSDGSGTTFQLYFPITRDELSDADLSKPIKDYKGDGETILVIDDVKTQREISCKMLDKLGYKTKAVASGEEAIEYLKEHTVDLMLLDMIMDPGINGRKTYKRIKKIHPNQKAIIVSGFAETDEVKETIKLGARQYIKKPFTLEKIGIAVKEELKK